MPKTSGDLFELALTLPPSERVKLAQDLLESVDTDEVGEFSPEWVEEIERRARLALAGEGGLDEDWRKVVASLRQQLTRSQ